MRNESKFLFWLLALLFLMMALGFFVDKCQAQTDSLFVYNVKWTLVSANISSPPPRIDEYGCISYISLAIGYVYYDRTQHEKMFYSKSELEKWLINAPKKSDCAWYSYDYIENIKIDSTMVKK